MAHEITTNDGLALARESAWHGLGTVVPANFSVESGLQIAGLDWSVDQSALLAMTERRVGDLSKAERAEFGVSDDEARTNPSLVKTFRQMVKSHVANVRRDTGKVLGIVSKDYRPVQNRELGEFVKAVADDAANVRLESCGSVRGGQAVWFLAKTDTVIRVGKGGADEVFTYVNFSNAHDGKQSCWITPTSIRVVCANTLGASIVEAEGREKAGTSLRFRHDANIMEKITAARDTIHAAMRGIEVHRERIEALAAREFSTDELNTFLVRVWERANNMPLPINPTTETEERAKRRALETLSAWVAKFEHGKGNQIPGVKGTAWAALNGVTEHADHVRTIRDKVDPRGARAYSNLFGPSADLKKVAFDTALAMVGAGS